MNAHQDAAKMSGGVSLADEKAVTEVLASSVLQLWEIVNNLTRLKPSRREHYRATIFGSARAKPGSFAYEETKRVAAALGELGCDIITGGGPGLMRAANEGAALHSEQVQSLGIRIALPFEQEANAFVSQAFEHRTFFTRLHQFVLTSDAYIVAPGGIGTVLETMMIWQLLQVGHIQNSPLILVGPMWPGLVEWARNSMLSFDPPLANRNDFAIPHCVPNGDEAVAIIREHHAKWKAANPEIADGKAENTKGTSPEH